MKRALILLWALMAGLASLPAYADNPDVGNALKSRPDLSGFYQALVDTGVAGELAPDRSYTLFAPDNEAIKDLEYTPSCLNFTPCKAEVAEILRNHIFAGNVNINDAVQDQGGLFSIGNRFVRINEPVKGEYTLDGQDVLSATAIDRGMLYTIDGVIASNREQDMLSLLVYSAEPHVLSSTVRRHTIPAPSCGSAGCPDSYTKTTIIEESPPAIVPASEK